MKPGQSGWYVCAECQSYILVHNTLFNFVIKDSSIKFSLQKIFTQNWKM